MRNVLYLILIALSIVSCVSTQKIKISVENPSRFDRNEELIEIDLSKIYFTKSSDKYWIVKNQNNEILPAQTTSDNKLIFQSGLKAKELAIFTIKKGKKNQQFEPKVFGRIYPERKDDIAWENDKIGFRFYGNALKELEGPSNALDLWFKRTNRMILDEWYKKSIEEKISYHVDHGEGCDPYAVGRTLGAGAMAPLVNGKLILNENYLSAEISDFGPLRFTATLHYPEMEINGKLVEESKTVSLDAGSQLTKITQFFNVKEETKVAVGVVKRKENDSILWNNETNYFIYQEPISKENGQIFIGVLFPNGLDSVGVQSYEYLHPLRKEVQQFSHILGYKTYQPSTPITYYTGFGWSKFGFETVESFENYMSQFNESLKKPLIITYSK